MVMTSLVEVYTSEAAVPLMLDSAEIIAHLAVNTLFPDPTGK